MNLEASWRKTMTLVMAAMSLVAASCGGIDSVSEQGGEPESAPASATSAPLSEATEPAPEPTAMPDPTATPEPTPLPEPTSTPQPDLDGDGEPDATDEDDDGDGAADEVDDFPTDPNRSRALATYFPSGDDGLVLLDTAATKALQAVRAELATETTTVEDVETLFSEPAIAGFGAQALADSLNAYRDAGLANAVVVDVRYVSEYDLRVALGAADGSDSNDVRLAIDADTGLLTFLSIAPASVELASLVKPEQSELELDDAVAGYVALAPTASVLVAEVVAGECNVLAAHEPAAPVGVATVANGWVLGAAADAIASGAITASESISVPPSTFGGVGSVSTGAFTQPTDLAVQQLADLMVQRGDAGAADALHELVGQGAIDSYIESHAPDPSTAIPMLTASHVSHLHESVDVATAAAFLDGADEFQRAQLEETFAPLGRFNSTSRVGAAITADQTWQSTASDVCTNLAALRSYPDHSASAEFVNQAMSGSTGLPGLATSWDRVWHIAGGHPNPAFGQFSAFNVHSLAWLVENEGGRAYVIVATMNGDGVPITPWILDAYSHVTRMHELLIER